MAKLHHCADGTLVTNKVLEYQESRSGDAYIAVHAYYENYKERWYSDLQDYMDRSTFDSEFDFKLYRAVDTFNEVQARKLCAKYHWKFDGAFNRWFYACLRNWRSNVKTSAFRQKKRPSVQCPVCGRYVPRIDEIHLAHVKTKSDLPPVVRWENNIYAVYAIAGPLAVCWGEYSLKKFKDLTNGKTAEHSYEKSRVQWPWFTPDGRRGVFCPFTRQIVNQINTDYLLTLPKEQGRYARAISWQDFVEEYPNPVLIQSEIYSLDYHAADDDPSFQESIASPERAILMGHEEVARNQVSMEYEHVFYLIESHIEDEIDQKVLKLASVGYSDEDTASALEIPKKEVRQRKASIRNGSDELKRRLLDSV